MAQITAAIPTAINNTVYCKEKDTSDDNQTEGKKKKKHIYTINNCILSFLTRG
jgi:hypothetical protein